MAKPYLEQLRNMIDDLGFKTSGHIILKCKHFFSGAALFVNGKICASLTPAGLGVKLPKEVRDKILFEGKGTELQYFKNAPFKKEYVTLPQSIVDDPVQMRSLLSISIEYILKLSVGWQDSDHLFIRSSR